MKLNVAMIVPRTEAEGPGVRYAIWVQGCPMRCRGCCNPEMLDFRTVREIETQELVAEAVKSGVEGVSFLGGEPFSQAGALAEVAEGVALAGLTVMIFSGYTRAELDQLGEDAKRLLAATDLLVDGRYEEDQRTLTRRWIGSSNQVLHFLSDRHSPDDPRFSAPNTIELRLDKHGATLNGFPIAGSRTRF